MRNKTVLFFTLVATTALEQSLKQFCKFLATLKQFHFCFIAVVTKTELK